VHFCNTLGFWEFSLLRYTHTLEARYDNRGLESVSPDIIFLMADLIGTTVCDRARDTRHAFNLFDVTRGRGSLSFTAFFSLVRGPEKTDADVFSSALQPLCLRMGMKEGRCIRRTGLYKTFGPTNTHICTYLGTFLVSTQMGNASLPLLTTEKVGW